MDLSSSVLSVAMAATAIALVIHLCLHGSRIGRNVDRIPGPRGFPLIGNLLNFAITPEEIFLLMRKLSKEFYPTYKYWLLHRPLVHIQHPDDIQLLLTSTKNIEKTLTADLLRPWINESLLISKGDKWRSRRKLLNYSFSYNFHEESVKTFGEQTHRLLTKLKAEANAGDGQVVKEVQPMFSILSLMILCETTMGTNLDVDNRDQYEYSKAIYVVTDIFQYRFTRPWLANDWIFSLTKRGKEQKKALKVIHGFSRNIIEARKDYHRMTGWKHVNETSGEKAGGNADDVVMESKTKNRRKLVLLDLLLDTWRNAGIDDKGLQEEVDVFVAAGHDTTSTVMSLAVLVLAEHKDIQEKCRKEIKEVLNGTPIDKITIKEVQRLNYLQQCIKESLRLYGVAPLIARKLSEDVQLKNHLLPRGTEVAINIYDTHRDPNFWPDADVFNPDRFSPEASQGRHPYAYLPFSLGPRNCIGNKFAMMELKVVIAGLISNFYLEPVDLINDAHFFMDFIIRCRDKLKVKLVPIVN